MRMRHGTIGRIEGGVEIKDAAKIPVSSFPSDKEFITGRSLGRQNLDGNGFAGLGVERLCPVTESASLTPQW